MNAELYSPSYLFQPGPRPSITAVSAPSYGNDGDPEIGYNDQLSYTVDDANAGNIQQVSFIRLPSVTHSFNQNQWFYRPQIVAQNGNQVTIQTTYRYEELPPGHYMMFALNGKGVPSGAWIIRVRDPNNPWHSFPN